MTITELIDTGDADDWDEDGNPTVSLFANAVQVWSWAQARAVVTVEEAALAFNVKPELIVQAVEWHPWLFLNGNFIEHEGE